MKNKILCTVCGKGHVTAQTQAVDSQYKGLIRSIDLHYLICDTCNSDFATEKESTLNKNLVMAFRNSVDGLSTIN
jgi:HTH-type transcriptional regulator/antitoxin MqsA